MIGNDHWTVEIERLGAKPATSWRGGRSPAGRLMRFVSGECRRRPELVPTALGSVGR